MSYDTTFYDLIAPGCRDSAAEVVPLLMDLFSPRTVLDVGCGEGWWLAEFAQKGCSVAGIDGDYIPAERLRIAENEYIRMDLAAILELGGMPNLGQRDMVMALEVAEHLPAAVAEAFVAALVAAAPVVVFSAAIPGQGGVGHMNEQWPLYWWDLFAAHGYQGTGALRWRLWANDKVENWYRQNLFLYVHPDLTAGMTGLFSGPAYGPVPVVHPVLWDSRR